MTTKQRKNQQSVTLETKCIKIQLFKISKTFDDFEVLGLASYPSSGNTWLRYLIEGITGFYTGSMYNDIMLRKKGFYGEGIPADSGMVLTVKTHGHTTGEGAHVARDKQVMYNHHREVNNTAILLIRNPFKAIIGRKCDLTTMDCFCFQDTGIWMQVATRVLLRRSNSRAGAGRALWK